MRKTYLVFILIVALSITAGCSKGYESRKNAGDLEITLKADRYPLVKGKNTMTVVVTDSAGKPVTDALVQAKYYMPAMTGMAPVEFSAAAVRKGKGYTFKADIPMGGAWKIDVMTAQPGKPLLTATFTIDAR